MRNFAKRHAGFESCFQKFPERIWKNKFIIFNYDIFRLFVNLIICPEILSQKSKISRKLLFFEFGRVLPIRQAGLSAVPPSGFIPTLVSLAPERLRRGYYPSRVHNLRVFCYNLFHEIYARLHSSLQ